MSNNLEKLNSFVQELEVKMVQNGQSSVLLEGQDELLGSGMEARGNGGNCSNSTNPSKCQNASNCNGSANMYACDNYDNCQNTNNQVTCTGGSTGGRSINGVSGQAGIGFPSVMF